MFSMDVVSINISASNIPPTCRMFPLMLAKSWPAELLKTHPGPSDEALLLCLVVESTFPGGAESCPLSY